MSKCRRHRGSGYLETDHQVATGVVESVHLVLSQLKNSPKQASRASNNTDTSVT